MAAKTLAAEEGFSAKAYWDPQGQNKLVSIGYGHQIKQNEYAQGYIQAGDERIPIVGDKGIDTKITKEQALKLKEKDLEIYTNDTIKSIGQDAWNKLSDQQKVALVSSTYNTGKGGMDYLVKNGLRDAIIREDYKGAADIIRKYGFKTEKGQKSPALEKRRNREAAMFEEGTASKLQPQSQNNLGNQIDTSSVENKNLKKDVNDLPASINVNNTNINKTTNTSPKTEESKEDDRPAYLKKRRG
jgi:GH24 family phage-related lysozyme (muramidase)